MYIFKIILLIILININKITAHKIKKIKISNDLSPLNHIVVQIIHVCHPDYKTLIVGDDNDDYISSGLLKSLNSKTSVILIENLKKKNNNIVGLKKIDAFILFIKANDKKSNLIHVLKNFRKSPWKRQMPSFFIFYKLNNNCGMAVDVLTTMWKFYLISYFICIDRDSTFIFTCNPFSSRAPFPWKLKKVIRIGDPVSNWTLYGRKYQTETDCDQFDFDRTKFLDKYPVKIASQQRANLPNVKFRKTAKIFDNVHFKNASKLYQVSTAGYFTREMASALNVSVSLKLYPGMLDHPYEMLKYFKQIYHNDSSSDIHAIPFIFEKPDTEFYELTFPVYCRALGILTRYRGLKTPIEKIRDFYGILTLLSTIAILFIVFAVIWFAEKRRIYFAAFEIIRLLINNGLLTKMDTLPLRIFFSVILLYFLIIQATFSGNLANFLTKPESRKHPETLMDLNNFGFKRVYGGKSVNYSMVNLEKDGGPKFITSNTCWKQVVNDSLAVCIHDYQNLFKAAQITHTKSPLVYHINKKPFGYKYSSYLIRSNWPLTNRVNLVVMWIWQSGLREYWDSLRAGIQVHRAKVTAANIQFTCNSITLEQLTFAFILLAVGIILATISFIIELFVGRKLYRIVTICKK